MIIEIDNGSGFCFGVTTAIKKAEEELAKGNVLYCLGDIVHNGMECERLKQMGLVTINHDDMAQLHGVKVLLRAHGEPPATYELARRNNIEIIDATCPVVLQLQKRIKQQYEAPLQSSPEGTSSTSSPKGEAGRGLVIFGKKGHAEVLGLEGQTQGTAIVIESFDEVKKLDEQGIVHAIRSQRDLEEAAGAYKDIEQVINNELDLVKILTRLLPIAVIKG